MTTGRIRKIPAHNAGYWIRTLGLKSHPEGGFYKETYRSGEIVSRSALPRRFKGSRTFCTAIYFLLTNKQVSKFHRIQSDELWHFYSGDPLRIHFLFPNGDYAFQDLGCSAQGVSFQAVVPAGVWFGAELHSGSRYSLLGCTVSPGFDFKDFALGDRESLLQKYPDHKALILRLTEETSS